MLKFKKNQIHLIYVYRDSCYYCQIRKPKFEFDVKLLKNFVPHTVHFYQYETGEQMEALNEFLRKNSNITITHFPVLLGISKRGEIFETDESNSQEQIAAFLNDLYRS